MIKITGRKGATILYCFFRLFPISEVREKKCKVDKIFEFYLFEEYLLSYSDRFFGYRSNLCCIKIGRYLLFLKQAPKMGIPSLIAVNIILSKKIIVQTQMAHTPILPYPATIHTVFLNYQDVLEQKGQFVWSFWCHKGVSHIAQELQLLNPTLPSICNR